VRTLLWLTLVVAAFLAGYSAQVLKQKAEGDYLRWNARAK
jgi:hypothetical protein